MQDISNLFLLSEKEKKSVSNFNYLNSNIAVFHQYAIE